MAIITDAAGIVTGSNPVTCTQSSKQPWTQKRNLSSAARAIGELQPPTPWKRRSVG